RRHRALRPRHRRAAAGRRGRPGRSDRVPRLMQLGPDNGTLTVHTGRAGAAAKAGHDLLIEVTRWSATLDEGAIELTADAGSLRVLKGTGGMTELDEGDKAGIKQTIDEEILKRLPIGFRSTRVRRTGNRLEVEGELEL